MTWTSLVWLGDLADKLTRTLRGRKPVRRADESLWQEAFLRVEKEANEAAKSQWQEAFLRVEREANAEAAKYGQWETLIQDEGRYA